MARGLGIERPPWWAIVGIVVSLAAAGVMAVMYSNRPTPPPYEGLAVEEAYATPDERTYVTLAAVGDSITQGDSLDFAGGSFGERSWVRYAVGEDLRFAGGWAQGGARTSLMRESVKPVDADVLVIVAGTNDSGEGTPFGQVAESLRAVAQTVGASRIVLSSIPPRDEAPQVAVDFNQQLAAFAADQRWDFVDAAAGVRTPENTYAPGMTEDGIHPTPQASRIIGEAIRAHILEG